MDEITFDSFVSADPTWNKANEIVNEYFPITTQTWQLVKASWYGEADLVRYVRTISFSYLDPKCLLVAAEMNDPAEFEPDVNTLQQAIQFLGVKLSAVVLSTELVCRMVLKTQPKNYWQRIFRDMITSIEIGYRFGSKCKDLGLEAGALMGLARYAGSSILLASNHQKYKELESLKEEKGYGRAQRELFGCQDYQIAAIVLQKLGYGSDVALGAALGVGKIIGEHNTYSREILTWRNAVHWISAIESGKPYPDERTINRFFSELAPPGPDAENLNLNALAEEVKTVVENGSSWMWHVPRGGYTEAALQSASS